MIFCESSLIIRCRFIDWRRQCAFSSLIIKLNIWYSFFLRKIIKPNKFATEICHTQNRYFNAEIAYICLQDNIRGKTRMFSILSLKWCNILWHFRGFEYTYKLCDVFIQRQQKYTVNIYSFCKICLTKGSLIWIFGMKLVENYEIRSAQSKWYTEYRLGVSIRLKFNSLNSFSVAL